MGDDWDASNMNDFGMGGMGGMGDMGDSDDEEEEEHQHVHGEHCNHDHGASTEAANAQKNADLGDLDADAE